MSLSFILKGKQEKLWWDYALLENGGGVHVTYWLSGVCFWVRNKEVGVVSLLLCSDEMARSPLLPRRHAPDLGGAAHRP